MKSLKVFILIALASVVSCGGPSPCEPFVSNFQPFLQAWLDVIDQFKNLAIDFSTSYPIFGPALAEGLSCRITSAVEFAGSAISRFSGVNEQDVVSILNGSPASELGAPLDCISDDLVYIQQRISSIFVEVIPSLENIVDTESTPSSCSEAIARLEPLAEEGAAFVQQLDDFVMHNIEVFSVLGLEDLYISNLNSTFPCFLKMIGDGLGTILNADGSSVTQYLSGEVSDVPYPFNCIEGALDYIKDEFY